MFVGELVVCPLLAFTETTMDGNGNTIVYFYKLLVPVVRVIPLGEIRPSMEGQKVFQKTVCFARTKNEEKPCIVLTIEHVRSYEVLCRDAYGELEQKYEDLGRRWTEELQLIPTSAPEPNKINQPAPLIPAVVVGLAATQPDKPPNIIKPEEDGPERPPSVIFLGEIIALSESSTHSETEVSSAVAGAPVLSPLDTARVDDIIPEAKEERNVATPADIASSSQSQQSGFQSDKASAASDTSVGEPAKSSPMTRETPKRGLSISNHEQNEPKRLRVAVSPKLPMSEFPNASEEINDPDWEDSVGSVSSSDDESITGKPSKFRWEKGGIPCRKVSLKSNKVSVQSTDVSPTTDFTIPKKISMVQSFRTKYEKKKSYRIPIKVSSPDPTSEEFIETKDLFKGMLSEKSWRSGLKYLVRRVFHENDLKISVCKPKGLGRASKANNCETLVLCQIKLDMIIGLIGIYCKQKQIGKPCVIEVYQRIMGLKYRLNKLPSQKQPL